MIDKSLQRKGYRRQAVEKLISDIEIMPYGEANGIFTSFEPDNIGSKTLFASFEFEETREAEGDKDSGDYEVIVELGYRDMRS